MLERFSPSSKGESSSFSSLGSGLVNNEGRGLKREKSWGSESESWHAEPGKLRVVTSAVLGRTFKNEPFLHFVEVSLLPPL